MWPKETIPDEAKLYRWVKNSYFVDGEVGPGAFRNSTDPDGNKTDGMSVNWDEYSTCEGTRDDLAHEGRNPDEYGVVAMTAQMVRTMVVPVQIVEHEPTTGNRAHSEVKGEKTKKTQKMLRDV